MTLDIIIALVGLGFACGVLLACLRLRKATGLSALGNLWRIMTQRDGGTGEER